MTERRDSSLPWVGWPAMTDDGIGAWVEHPDRYLCNRCDRCGKRRLFFRLYDVWPHKGMAHFGWVCADCLIEVIGVRRDADEAKWEAVTVQNLGDFMRLQEAAGLSNDELLAVLANDPPEEERGAAGAYQHNPRRL